MFRSHMGGVHVIVVGAFARYIIASWACHWSCNRVIDRLTAHSLIGVGYDPIVMHENIVHKIKY